jgi:hypothetical protein
MNKYSKSIIVNLILIVIGFILTVCLIATQKEGSDKFNSTDSSEATPNQKVDKIEIPTKIVGRTDYN